MWKKSIRMLSKLVLAATLLGGLCVAAQPLPSHADPPPPRITPWLNPGPDLGLPLPMPGAAPAGKAAPAAPHVPSYTPWSRIAFQSARNQHDWDIYIADGGGGGQTRLTYTPAHDFHPSLNRGVTRVAFVSNRDGNNEIYVMNADGSGQTRLTQTPASEAMPAWSPDGTRIAFQSYRDGNWEVYVMNADGANQTRLTNSPGFDGHPAWSPDGTRIAFSSDRSGRWEIWTMNADGSGQTQLTYGMNSAELPSWSPDGATIAFDNDGNNDGWQELWLVNADGTGARTVYNPGSSTDAWTGAWSPDGRWVAFTQISWTYQGGQWYWTWADIRLWNVQGWWPTTITFSGTDWLPDWASLDPDPPSSAVKPLPAQSPAQFTVSWSGTDAGPSGIASYDVQYKDGAGGAWINWYSQTLWTEAQFTGQGGHTYYFRCRAWDAAGNVERYPDQPDASTTVEALQPTSHVEPLPAYTRGLEGGFLVRWTGIDPGGSGIQWYDVQFRDGPDGTWTDWFYQVPWTQNWFYSELGHTYYFRCRARDTAGNVEPYPPGDGDTHTTVYAVSLSGAIRDNRDAPLPGARLITSPDAINVVTSDEEGRYIAYLPTTGDFGVTVAKDGYGALTPTSIWLTDDRTDFDLVVPPPDNAVANGDFEAGSLDPAWLAGGVATPTLTTTFWHTGQYAATLGQPLTAEVSRVVATDGNSTSPALAFDAEGTLHLVWVDNSEGSEELFYSAKPPGGAWSAPVNVSNSPWVSMDPALAIAPDGTLHLMWQDSFSDHYDIFYATRPPGGTWSAPFNVSRMPSDSEAMTPDLAVEADGTLHAVWMEHIPAQDDWRHIVYSRRAPGGNWSAPVDVSANPPGTGWAEEPTLAVDGLGTVHAAWQRYEWTNWEVHVASRPRGGVWSAPVNVSRSPGDSGPPDIAASPSGVVHLVWRDWIFDQPDIFYASRPRGGAWSYPVDISNTPGESEYPAIAYDSLGRLHAAWKDSTHNNPEIFYTHKLTAGGWWAATNLSYTPGDSWLPAIAVDAAGLPHLAWVEQFDGAGLQADIAYAWLSNFRERTGDSSLTQAVALSEDLHMPTLSFLYQLTSFDSGENDWFEVTLDDGSGPIRVFTATQETGQALAASSSNGAEWGTGDREPRAKNAPRSTLSAPRGSDASGLQAPATQPWIHAWVDLSAWAGRAITLTFNVHATANDLRTFVHLDEVSVGSAYPNLWLRKSGMPWALPGQMVWYRLDYGNRGAVPASGVLITDTLPPGVTYVAADPPPASTVPQLTWEVGTLTGGSGPYTITITGTVDTHWPLGTVVTNQARISTTAPEPDAANNAAASRTDVNLRTFLPVTPHNAIQAESTSR